MSARFPTINSGVINATECIREGKALIDDRYWPMVGICFVGYLIAGSAPFYILYGPMICGIYYCTLALKRGEPTETKPSRSRIVTAFPGTAMLPPNDGGSESQRASAARMIASAVGRRSRSTVLVSSRAGLSMMSRSSSS